MEKWISFQAEISRTCAVGSGHTPTALPPSGNKGGSGLQGGLRNGATVGG